VKLLSENDMVQLAPADGPDLVALADRMGPLRDGDIPPWLLDATERGACQATTVVHEGERVAVFWHWFSASNFTLVINAAGSLVERNVFPLIVAGGEKLARSLGAKAVQFETRRRGLIERSRTFGYHVDGVLMRKELP